MTAPTSRMPAGALLPLSLPPTYSCTYRCAKYLREVRWYSVCVPSFNAPSVRIQVWKKFGKKTVRPSCGSLSLGCSGHGNRSEPAQHNSGLRPSFGPLCRQTGKISLQTTVFYAGTCLAFSGTINIACHYWRGSGALTRLSRVSDPPSSKRGNMFELNLRHCVAGLAQREVFGPRLEL